MLPLLSVSPMAKTSDGGGKDADEGTDFDAVNHFRHLEDVFQYYNIDVHDWVCCSIADNCGVIKRLAHLFHVPHVGYLSHKMNLEVNFMVK